MKAIICIVLISFLSLCTYAQSLEQVMESFFTKIGGKEKVASIKSSKEISYNWFRRNSEDNPEKTKPIKTMTIAKEPYYKRFVSFDSKDNWTNEFYYNEKGSVMAMGSVIEKGADPTPISICTAADMLEWYVKGKLKNHGKDRIKEEEYDVISRVENNGLEFYFFNTKTHLLDASQKAEWPGRVIRYKEYKETNLILHPFLLENYQNEIVFYSQATEVFEFNPTIDDRVFYFNEKEYEDRNKPKIKYESIRLDAREADLSSFIKSNFSGKRVLVDMWATWCGPCKREFKSYDSTYYSMMEKQNINLVYLSIDKDIDKKKWESDINKLGLKGYHARATNQMVLSIQNTIFEGGAITIPRYILIDETGDIISKDFTRPSDPNFDKLLERAFNPTDLEKK